MRPRHPYQVRDRKELREHVNASQRVVQHSIRSLAALVGVSPTTLGDLLTGKQQRVTGDLAQRLSAVLGRPVDDLFVPTTSPTRDKDAQVSP